MNLATVRVQKALAVALFCAVVALNAVVTTADAQTVRGIVKSRTNGRSFESAHVVALDTEGRELGNATTDENGRFFLKLKSIAKPIIITILRIGISPTKSDPLTFVAHDTSDFEFLVDEEAVRTDTMRIAGRVSPNERSLLDAERRGWSVYSPKEVALHRENARSLREMVQSLAGAGVIVPNRDGDCFRSTRNNLCLTLVVDNRPVGTTFGIAPAEIYFMALVSKSDAATQWGSNNVPNGALAIYTRMFGDRIR
jgi:hypothetical protein